jgi:hypothetical protein
MKHVACGNVGLYLPVTRDMGATPGPWVYERERASCENAYASNFACPFAWWLRYAGYKAGRGTPIGTSVCRLKLEISVANDRRVLTYSSILNSYAVQVDTASPSFSDS